MKAYYCKSCGAQLIVNADDHFTNCLYCGNAVAFKTDELEDMNIRKVIPFSIDKEEAIKIFTKLSKKKVVNAKKVFVPVRFCDFKFSHLYYYQKRVEHKDDDGDTYYTYHDEEKLKEGNIDDEFIFGNSIINNIELQDEIRLENRLDFDPVIIDDVSIELCDFDNIDVKKLLENNIRRFVHQKYSNIDIVQVYSENYFITDVNLEPFVTLIPVYIMYTENGLIYNIPGVKMEKTKKKAKYKGVGNLLLIITALLTVASCFITKGPLVNLKFLFGITFVYLVLNLKIKNSNPFKTKTYDNYNVIDIPFSFKRKQLK